jgi:hypothetical protein
MPLLTALEVLGYDLTSDQREAIIKEVERRMQVQERIAAAEAGQGGPTPASPRGGEALQTAGQNSQDGADPTPTSPREGEANNGSAVRSALFHWKQAALKAVKTGHDLKDLDFDHPSIPDDAAKKIRAALKTCKSAEDVYSVFGKARGWASTLEKTSSAGSSASVQENIPIEKDMLAELKRANDLLEMTL